MRYYIEFEGKTYERNSNSRVYRYANVYRTAEGEFEVTWHTAIDAAHKADAKIRRDWQDGRVNVAYLTPVYSDTERPQATRTHAKVRMTADWQQQDAWRERYMPGASRDMANNAMWDQFHEQLRAAIAELPIVKELGLTPTFDGRL